MFCYSKLDRRRRRLGPSQSTQGLSRPACAAHARLQDGSAAIPRHGGHVHLVRAHGLQHVRHLHGVRRHTRAAAAAATRQGH